MRHQIENGSLTLEADTHGAELCSLRKAGGPAELLWSADPAVWGRARAALHFPWCGRMRDNYFEEGGRRYEAGSHGFARDMEHLLSASGPDFLTFRLGWNGETPRPLAVEVFARDHPPAGGGFRRDRLPRPERGQPPDALPARLPHRAALPLHAGKGRDRLPRAL